MFVPLCAPFLLSSPNQSHLYQKPTVKKTILWLLLTGICTGVYAQPRVKLDNEIANMGEVMFQLPAKATFTLMNDGKDPLQITKVHPSCGCTKVEWTREAIPPGGKGTIEAWYDAKMLGVFQKDIEVYTNASADPIFLHLQGRVVAKMTDYTGTFPIQMGTLRLSTNDIVFDNVNKGDHPQAELQIVNTSRKSYKPQLMHLPPYLTAQYLPETLAGGRIGRILLTLDSEKLMQMGLTQTSVYLSRYMGDKIEDENEIDVSAILLPDFSHLSAADRANAPKLQTSTDSLVLKPSSGKKYILFGEERSPSGTILLTNTGQTPLHINMVQVFSKALGVKLGNRVIAPGKATKLKVTVQNKDRKKNKTVPRILLITDDPAQPKKIIKITVSPK